MLREKLIAPGGRYPALSPSQSLRQGGDAESPRIFEELPTARIVAVSRPDASDITPLLLSYTIELTYKQFKWQLSKKASQVIYLHLALKKRAIIKEFHEKHDQVREWLNHIGLGDHGTIVRDEDEPDDGAVPIYSDDSSKNRSVPSRAALSIIRPAIGKQQSISDKAKSAMQGYLNHFLGNLEIVNSSEVCKFLEVSTLSFSQEYGPKLKEGYVMINDLEVSTADNACSACCLCHSFGCCGNNWRKVWLVLKPGFMAFLPNHFDTKLLDIFIFDVLPDSHATGDDSEIYLAKSVKERNPLRHAFKVSCSNKDIKIRTPNHAKAQDWVSAINMVGSKQSESWFHPHRFSSYAPVRGHIDDGSKAQWFIDGKAAFEAIALSIENAKSDIYITGWWLCPELFLRRPFHDHNLSRLDYLLEAKAKQGVQIYILLYKEVSLALKINSFYSKKKLLNIHENIRVLRYPDHLSSGIYLWSHHEKVVIVDHKICFIGGLDLCFGRYDTTEHQIGDYPASVWPGKDYYNPRESEPNSWEDALKDELDRQKYPRMPWHDVHCAIWGPACRDVARHFVQRWNHAKRSKAPNERRIPLLIPQHHMVLPHYMGKSSEIDVEISNVKSEDQHMGDSSPQQTPPENIPLLLPQEAIDLNDANRENSHGPISNAINKTGGVVDDGIIPTSILTEDVPDYDLEAKDYWWEAQEQQHFTDMSVDEVAQVGPPSLCECQVIRSVSQWSAGTSQTEDSIHRAYCSLIEEAEHFVYIENQFFISGLSEDEVILNRVLESIYKRIMRAHEERKSFRVIVVIPLLPGFQGGVDDVGAATVRAIMHWQYRTICRGETSILQKLTSKLGPLAHDYISFFGLRTYGRLHEGGPVVTSQIYVHSKVIIIDDRCALIGSSNINDRSLLGSRDSEIGVLIKDREFVESSMNGQPWKAGKFSHSLRLNLWSEHLGLSPQQAAQIMDPIAETTFRDLWLEIAQSNTKIFEDVFSCIPNDTIRSRSALRQSMSNWKQQNQHASTTTDLGVAPEKLELRENGRVVFVLVTDPMEKLKSSVRGHLVSFPLEFMSQEEDLRPMFIEGEFYASPQVFH